MCGRQSSARRLRTGQAARRSSRLPPSIRRGRKKETPRRAGRPVRWPGAFFVPSFFFFSFFFPNAGCRSNTHLWWKLGDARAAAVLRETLGPDSHSDCLLTPLRASRRRLVQFSRHEKSPPHSHPAVHLTITIAPLELDRRRGRPPGSLARKNQVKSLLVERASCNTANTPLWIQVFHHLLL